MPEVFDLSEFDSYREGNRLEVKAANGGLPGRLWDTYSSFANSYGGCIICGVVERKDGSWKTTGLKDLPRLKKIFWDAIHNRSKVSLCLITIGILKPRSLRNIVSSEATIKSSCLWTLCTTTSLVDGANVILNMFLR